MEGISKPNDLIPRDTMVMVLKDLTVIESHIQNKYVSVTRFKRIMEISGDHVLKDYNLSMKRLERSMDYYGSRQELMSGIYAEILDSLNREASIYAIDNLQKADTVENQAFKGIKAKPINGLTQ
jgi:hypothetical protein